jgi:hypothetical protein
VVSNNRNILDLLLEELQVLKGGQKLGFGVRQQATIVYCNRQYNSLWYTLDYSTEKPTEIVIDESDFTGFVKGLDIKESEYKGKPVHKVRLRMDANAPYVFEAGLETEFGKGLISSLTEINNFSEPITIAPQAGESESVLFCRMFQGGKYIKGQQDCDYQRAIKAIQQRLGQSSENQKPEPAETFRPEPVPEPETETIEYEYSMDDEQEELIPTKTADELNAEIKGMTINTAQFVLDEINRNAQSLGINHGGVVTRHGKHLSELKATAEEAMAKVKAVGMSGAEAKAKLGGARNDCTLDKLKSFAKSIVLPEPETDVDLTEIPF